MSAWKPTDSDEVAMFSFMMIVITISACFIISEIGDSIAKTRGTYAYSEQSNKIRVEYNSNGNTEALKK